MNGLLSALLELSSTFFAEYPSALLLMILVHQSLADSLLQVISSDVHEETALGLLIINTPQEHIPHDFSPPFNFYIYIIIQLLATSICPIAAVISIFFHDLPQILYRTCT